MKFVFWQNVISIHQSAFLRSLAMNNDVILVVEQNQSYERVKQGWCTPNTGNVIIKTSPSINDINQIIKENQNSWHIFSGIYANKMVLQALNIAALQKVNLGVMFEPFNPKGLKGLLRFTINLWYRKKLQDKIKFILPTGNFACNQYEKVGYIPEKIFQWGYFTEYSNNNNNKTPNLKNQNKSLLMNILFIGQLIPRKNIISLVDLMVKYRELYSNFTIIGTGEQENIIKNKIIKSPKIKMTGSLPNDKVKEMLSTVDLLVLPSKFDGWGAVVNEALQVGTPVIASENCGSSVLLDGNVRGEVFNFNNSNNLESILIKWLRKGKINSEKRMEIIKWTRNNISGEVSSNYFIDVINYVEGRTLERPKAPWIKD